MEGPQAFGTHSLMQVGTFLITFFIVYNQLGLDYFICLLLIYLRNLQSFFFFKKKKTLRWKEEEEEEAADLISFSLLDLHHYLFLDFIEKSTKRRKEKRITIGF